MPLYEYKCNQCGKVFTFLVGVVANNLEPKCPRCNSTNLNKLISRVRTHLSEESRLDNLASSFENMNLSENPSPKEIRAFMHKLTSSMGDEIDREMIDEMEEALESEFKGKDKNENLERDEAIY